MRWLAFALLSVTTIQAANVRKLHESAEMLSPPPCKFEDGVDYVGNDIANRQAPRSDCCRQCWITHGCKAWSWTAYNGGTCWLKSKRANVAYNPGVYSGTRDEGGSDDGEPSCPVEENLDYVDFDIGNAPSPHVNGCCDICRDFPGCRAFSWSSYRGGTCWLKRAKGVTIWNPNVKSGIIPGDPISSCSMDYGVDYVGNDIANKHGESADACCEICHNHPGCKAFSWNSHNGGTCWLKSGKTETVNRPSVISSVVKRGCDITHKVDFVNYDIGNALGGHADDCCAKCLAYPNCNAFSWSDYRGGTCWFKSKKGDVVANDDVTSGVVQ